jgi:hypothetical protein
MKQGLVILFIILYAAAWSQQAQFTKLTVNMHHFPVDLSTTNYNSMTGDTTKGWSDQTIDLRTLEYPFNILAPGDMNWHTATDGPHSIMVQWNSTTNMIRRLTYKFTDIGTHSTEESLSFENVMVEPYGIGQYRRVLAASEIHPTKFHWKKIIYGEVGPVGTYYNEYLSEDDGFFTNTSVELIFDMEKLSAVNDEGAPAELSIYPNPATKQITIHGMDLKHITLLDVFGNALRIEPTLVSSREAVVDIEQLPNGIYTLMCNGTAKKLMVVK